MLCIGEWKKRPKVWVYKARSDFCTSLSGNTEICSFWAGVLSGSTSPDADSTGSSTESVAAGVGDGAAEADVSVELVSELFSELDKGVDDADLAFEHSSVKATIKGPVHSVKNPRTGNIVAESFGTIILDENLKAPGNCELKLWDGLTCFD